jgi:two-component system chemotaxis response regulator CheY
MTLPYWGSGKTVLLVDDNGDFLLSMEQLLTTFGFSVAKARNGAEGLAQLHAMHPSLIMLDIFMPLMDGLEFLRQVQGVGRPLPPIIAVTADQHRGREATMEAVGARAILFKPFSADELAEAINRVLPATMRSPPDPRTSNPGL